MSRILFTGSTGFLGKNVIPLLRKDFDVRGVHHESYTDLRSQDAVKKVLKAVRPKIVVHAAGTVGGIGANKANPGKFMYENLIMGANLIHQSMLEGVDKFILIGTVCAYPKYTPVPFRESELWNGYPEETNAPYGIAKKTLMTLLQTYQEQYKMQGINLVPVNMYGPHDHFNLTSSHVIPALILKVDNAIRSGSDSIELWGTGNASREFLYVEDCAAAIHAAITADVGAEPVNVGTGQEIRISELITRICTIMGYDGTIHYDTTKPDGQPRRCLDITRAKELLGFEAQTDLQTGLEKTIQWYKENS